jgi:hypothetical protein
LLLPGFLALSDLRRYNPGLVAAPGTLGGLPRQQGRGSGPFY